MLIPGSSLWLSHLINRKLLQLAAKSVEKRDKIYRAFEEVKKALVFADPEKTSFKANADVATA